MAQVRESAALLVRFAKQSGTAIFLVGHVTKEGSLAGPRVLEHMVDTHAQPRPQIPADPDWPQSPAARNAQDLAELVMASPSSFHAAAEGARRLEAAGFDVVLVETVGIGQSEADIKHLADVVYLVTGDDDLTEAVSSHGSNADAHGSASNGIGGSVDPLVVFGVGKILRKVSHGDVVLSG